MRNRRLIVSAAVIAAGVGLVPGMAQAEESAKPDAHGVSAPDADLGKAAASNFGTFTSPAERTVRPAGKGKAQAQGTAASEPTVSLSAKGTSARGISLDLAVSVDPDAQISAYIEWGDGTTDVFDTDGPTNQTVAHSYAEIGAYTVKVTLKDATGDRGTNTLAVVTPGSDFTPYAPTRLLDTRNGTGGPKAKVPAYGTTRVQISGNGNIPAGVTAVVLNVTATNTTSGGHVTVWPAGSERPTTSNVNFAKGQTVPNLVIVPVDRNGFVNLYNGGWESVDLIADVTGYFTRTSSSGYTPLNPTRFVDTRNGTGTAPGKVRGQSAFGVKFTGRDGIPDGATAVALNVTVTNPREDGHLTVFPGGSTAPTTSNVNFRAGQTVANSVIVPVGPDGTVNFRNGSWNGTDVIVDVVGYYHADSQGAYLPFLPERLLDTRDSSDWVWGPLEGQGYIYMPLSTRSPANTAYVLNTTVTNTRGEGYLTVSPDPNSLSAYEGKWASWPTPPNSSNLNWKRNETVPNLVQAGMGYNGIVDFWNRGWDDIDLVVDIFGVYQTN
ncbi:PKD domain-containing protein [Streptomyces erythrochromogenes]|uniref:PKD domain-containing protein n=1 Tax=Streptomyces erythrochromogenes TaxID=285574 RepID=UPI00382A9454